MRDLAALLSGSYAIILAGVFRGVVEGDAGWRWRVCCSQEEQSDADSPLDGLDSGFTGRAADLEPASDEAAGVATPPPECVAPPPIVAHDGGGSDGSIGPFILIRVPGPTDQTGDAALFPHPDLTAQRRRRAMLPLTLTAALYGTCGNTAAEVTGAPVSRNRRVRHSGA